MVLWVVKFTHQSVDVWRCVSSDVGDEQCDELGRDIVKHRTVHIHLWENLTWNINRKIWVILKKIWQRGYVQIWKGFSKGGHVVEVSFVANVTFSEREHLMWGDKLMEGILFIWKLKYDISCSQKYEFNHLWGLKGDNSDFGVISYLRWELEHGSTNNQRCGVMLSCKGQCVCPVDGPQASIC